MKAVPSQPSRRQWHLSLAKESASVFHKESLHGKYLLKLYVCLSFSQNLALPPGKLTKNSHKLIFEDKLDVIQL